MFARSSGTFSEWSIYNEWQIGSIVCSCSSGERWGKLGEKCPSSSFLFSVARTRSGAYLQRRTPRWRARSSEQVEESVTRQRAPSFETGWYCSLVITCCQPTARKYAFDHQRVIRVASRQRARTRWEATRTITIRLARITEERSRSVEYAGRSG